MNNISLIILPILVLIIIIYGFYKKVPLYDLFTKGAKEGLITSFNIFPYILGMILSINILLKSNILSSILSIINPLLKLISFPVEVLPLAILRPISGTATLAVLNDILINYGPDSFIGLLASTMQGSTDTTLYVITLYFGSVNIIKSRYALKVGLFADFMGILSSFILVKLLF